MNRKATILLLAMLLAISTGCAVGQALGWGWLPGVKSYEEICAADPTNPDCGSLHPETLLFAAIADYNRAKAAALKFVTAPTTTYEEAQAVLTVVLRADMELSGVLDAWRSGTATDDDYSRVARTLSYAVTRINATIAASAARGA